MQAAQEAEAVAGAKVVLAIAGPAFANFDFTPPIRPIDGCTADVDGMIKPAAAAAAPALPPPQRLLIGGTPIYVASEAASLTEAGHEVQTASSVWTCAVVLSKALEHMQQQGRAVLHSNSRVCAWFSCLLCFCSQREKRGGGVHDRCSTVL
jgi:hypothetical protein